MATIYYDRDADPSLITSRKVAIIGYGSRGTPTPSTCGTRASTSGWACGKALPRAKRRVGGLESDRPGHGHVRSGCHHGLAPDTAQQAIYNESIEPNLRPGDVLMFAHGFNIRFGLIDPPEGIDVAMVAPKGPGHLVRRTYEGGGGRCPQPAGRRARRQRQGQTPRAFLRLGAGFHTCRRARNHLQGRDRDGPVRRASSAVRRAHVAHQGRVRHPGRGGLPTESAYFECLHEVKLIVDLIYEHGITGMRYSISTTAEYGDMTAPGQGDQRPSPSRDEKDTGGHTVGRVRYGMGGREPQRAPQLPPPAEARRRAPHREGRGRATGHDALPGGSGGPRPQDVSGAPDRGLCAPPSGGGRGCQEPGGRPRRL